MKTIKTEITIYKGEKQIGSLISKKLQKKIDKNSILPEISINKSKDD